MHEEVPSQLSLILSHFLRWIQFRKGIAKPEPCPIALLCRICKVSYSRIQVGAPMASSKSETAVCGISQPYFMS